MRAIANFIADLYPQSQREFVLGIFDDETKIDEDFVFIGSDPTRVEFIDPGRVPAA